MATDQKTTQQQSAPTKEAIALAAKKQLAFSRPTFMQITQNNERKFVEEMEFASQAFVNNSFLLTCDPVSIRNVLTNIVLSGLSLNPVLKYAYLVPRKVKGVHICCVDPSYMGLTKILTDTGSVIAISATVVYEKEIDTLDIVQGVGGHAKHKPYIGKDKPGLPIACYSVALLPGGIKHVELLRKWEWDGIKARSESVKNYNDKVSKKEWAAVPTWMTDEEEMIRKTAIKKHYKYLPKTERAIKAAEAIELDNIANGIDFDNQNTPPVPNAPAASTPNAPFQDALATEEDMEAIDALIDDKDCPDVVMGTFAKLKVKDNVRTRYNEGKLTKDVAEKYIATLKLEVSKAKETNAGQPPVAEDAPAEQTLPAETDNQAANPETEGEY